MTIQKSLQIIGFAICAILIQSQLFAQYKFKEDYQAKATKVKNQQRTGTCWSFSTTSFLESDLIRMGKGKHDLSEMFVVRKVYEDKAYNYVLRQGKANFSQGSLSHDLINAVSKHGIVPESVYMGRSKAEIAHNHTEMEAVLKGMLDALVTQRSVSKKWKTAFNSILDTYLGSTSAQFSQKDKSYTPKTYAKELGLEASNYISISSFSHHQFYSPFILEVPDNFSNGSFYNVPLNEMESILDDALKAGYTISLDTDVSENGFSAKEGLAILPVEFDEEKSFRNPQKELAVTQSNRQEGFESFATTDDHLMHITGIAHDQAGTKYYIVKNSWGEISDYKGYLYMSANYFRMKAISIMLHKDALSDEVSKKLSL
jgi:bleomycin hydrolase